jgi:hypothetical protein
VFLSSSMLSLHLDHDVGHSAAGERDDSSITDDSSEPDELKTVLKITMCQLCDLTIK